MCLCVAILPCVRINLKKINDENAKTLKNEECALGPGPLLGELIPILRPFSRRG